MSLIDKTYFVKDINIPDSTFSDLDAYITRYEKEILQHLLGYELWKLVDAYGAGDTGVIADLVEGKEYTIGSETVKWNGLINDDKVSLIAYYVYYWWVRNNATFTAITGERKAKDENSDPAAVNQRITNAWLRLEDLALSVDFPYDSLYMFLSTNEADYPEWVYTELGNVNGFDL